MSYWKMLENTYGGNDEADDWSTRLVKQAEKEAKESEEAKARQEQIGKAAIQSAQAEKPGKNEENNQESEQEGGTFKLETAKEYEDHPEKISVLVKELIDRRGDLDVANGQEKYSNIKTGGTWDNEQRAYVGPDGMPRDYAHLVGFLKKNPSRITDVLKELEAFDKNDDSNTENTEETTAEVVVRRPGHINFDAYDNGGAMSDAVFNRNTSTEPSAQNIEENTQADKRGDSSTPIQDPYAQVTFRDGTRTGEYLNSNEGNEELTTEKDFDTLSAAYDELVKRGEMTEEEAYRRKEEALNSAIGMIDQSRQGYLDRINGRINRTEERLPESPVEPTEAPTEQDEEEPTAEDDSEAASREEEEARSREEEEARGREEEEARGRTEHEALGGEHEGSPEDGSESESSDDSENPEAESPDENERDPELIAINADIRLDMEDLAHDLAEKQLNEENAKSGFIKRLWKGNLFRKYYEKKYEREFLSGRRTTEVDGQAMTVDDLITSQSDSAIRRFILAATNQYGELGKRFVHAEAGESLKQRPEDARATEVAREVISKFARRWLEESEGVSDLPKYQRELENDIQEELGRHRDRGVNINGVVAKSFVEVAINAAKAAHHAEGIAEVMRGFKLYDATVRDSVRTQAHRDGIDKIVNKYETGALGKIIPPEIIAGALGVVTSLTQSGARAAGGVGVGAGVAGIMAGLRERNRVIDDRTRMLRDVANGQEYSGNNLSDADIRRIRSRRARARARYEAKVGGTMYEMASANSLIENLRAAQESGDQNALLQAIAEARVRVDFSDSAGKDLISYTSASKRGDERLALDVALIEAERGITRENSEQYETIQHAIGSEIVRSVGEQDDSFTKLKRSLALKAAAKGFATTIAVAAISDEVVSLIDPNKVGVLEKVGVVKTANAETAKETFAASLIKRPNTRIETHSFDISGDQADTISQYESAGWSKTLKERGQVVSEERVVTTTPGESSLGRSFNRSWANNGTRGADGLERRLYLENGHFRAGMNGGSSTLGSRTFDFDSALAAGKVKGVITINGVDFEAVPTIDAAGQVTWGNNGVLELIGPDGTTGTVRFLGDNGKKLYSSFAVVVEDGVGTNGSTNIVALATDYVGKRSSDATITQIIPATVTPDIYTLSKLEVVAGAAREVARGAGIGVPIVNRIGLGKAFDTSNSEPSPRAEASAPETPAPAPESPASDSETPSPVPNGPAPASESPAPAPESTDEATNEMFMEDTPDFGDNPVSAPAVDVVEPTPSETESPSNPEDSEAENRRRFAREGLRDSFDAYGIPINDDGLDILSEEASYNGEDLSRNQRYAAWWSSLNNDTKDSIRMFLALRAEDGDTQGQAFYAWLRTQPDENEIFEGLLVGAGEDEPTGESLPTAA